MGNLGTAILLFSRLPSTEANFKNLSANPATNRLILQHLYDHTLSVTSRTQFTTIHYNEQFQHGNSFAERLNNAITELFEDGYSKLIVVGTDCPALSTRHIRAAAENLEEGNELILAPDKRGGVFLLGINRSAYNRQSFLKFNWQSRRLLSDIKKYAEDYNFIVFKSHVQDVHNYKDVIQIASAFFTPIRWRNLIYEIFYFSTTYYQYIFNNIKSSLPLSIFPLKAPPMPVY